MVGKNIYSLMRTNMNSKININISLSAVPVGSYFSFNNNLKVYKVTSSSMNFVTYQDIITRRLYTIFNDWDKAPWGLSKLEQTKVRIIKRR